MLSQVLDRLGIYCDATCESDLKHLLGSENCNEILHVVDQILLLVASYNISNFNPISLSFM